MYGKNIVDASLERSTDVYKLFSKPTPMTVESEADKGFGLDWTALSTGLISAGGLVYSTSQQKEIAADRLRTERRIATMQETTKRAELAIAAKQAELLASVQEKQPSGITAAGIFTPTTMMIAGGVGLLALMAMALKKKKGRR